MPYLLPANVLDDISKVILRKNSDFNVSRRSLRSLDQDIYALLRAVGANVDDSDYAREFRRAINDTPSHYEKAEAFRKVAAASNPLASKVCPKYVRAEIEVKFRRAAGGPPSNRRYHIVEASWDDLTQLEQQKVRAIAGHLEAQERSKVSQGAPEKSSHNALLVGLADTFLRATNDWTTDPLELPHSIRSLFIQFAHAAAAPFFPKTEVSLKAMSDRWASWKRSQKRAAGTFKSQKRQMRKRPTR